jgi:thiol-disulfide isomerase/thioredoxin
MRILTLCLALLLPAAAQEPAWLTDLAQAKAAAVAQNKKILADFTGSDWCPYCVLLNKEVFSTPAFAGLAKDYVLLKLDYPRMSGRTPEKIAADPGLKALMALKEQYRISGFPTVLVLSGTGEELARNQGYAKGQGPAAYMASLRK